MNKSNHVNRYFWLLFIVLALSACQKKEIFTTLSGKISYFENDSLTLIRVGDYFPSLVFNEKLIKVQADSTGYFVFKFSQAESDYYQVLYSNYHRLKYDIYLEQGDSIYIEQSSWQETPHFIINGKGSDKLTYLVKDYELFPKDKSFYEFIRSNRFDTELLFKSYIDSIQNLRIREVEANKTIPGKLKLDFIKWIEADHAQFLYNHLASRNQYMEDSYDYFYPDSTFYSFLDKMNFDSLFCKSSEAKVLARLFLENKARIALRDTSEEKWWNENLSWKLNYISKQPSSIWKDYLALSTISEYSFGLYKDDFFDKLNDFQHHMEDQFFRDSNQEIFQLGISQYKKLAPGKPAPDFALPDSSGNTVQLSDFKGKIVYLDFWGTWCYPCIQEIPGALELQEKYKEKPVVFLYVSMEYDDEDIATWKQFIKGESERFGHFLNNKPFPGIHLVAEKQFLNPNIKPYKINFAPTYVLIDQDGNIVSARAERPDNISDNIDELLEKIEVE